MEDKLWEAISELINKLYEKRRMAGVSKQIGDLFDECSQEILSDRVREIVKSSVNNASYAGLTSVIPGAGSAINATALASITWGMYADINATLNISFSDNFIKSVSSGICANLASSLLVGGVSLIPGIGTAISALGGIVNNRLALYSSAFVYIEALTTMVNKGNISEDKFSSELEPISRQRREYPQIGIVGHTGHGMTSLAKLTYTWSLEGVNSKAQYEDFHSIEKTLDGIKDLDGIILVVSACEGPMPQTYDIVLEAASKGVDIIAVYISNCTKEEEDMLELTELDTNDLLEHFDYENIPVVKGDSLSAYYKLKHNIKDRWGDAYLQLLRIVNDWELEGRDSNDEGDVMEQIYNEYGSDGAVFARRYLDYKSGNIGRSELMDGVYLNCSAINRIENLLD